MNSQRKKKRLLYFVKHFYVRAESCASLYLDPKRSQKIKKTLFFACNSLFLDNFWVFKTFLDKFGCLIYKWLFVYNQMRDHQSGCYFHYFLFSNPGFLAHKLFQPFQGQPSYYKNKTNSFQFFCKQCRNPCLFTAFQTNNRLWSKQCAIKFINNQRLKNETIVACTGRKFPLFSFSKLFYSFNNSNRKQTVFLIDVS